jgi:hypothetical protein
MSNNNVKGFILKKQYPGCNKPLGYFEPYTTGEFLNYPDFWEPVTTYEATRSEFYTLDKFKELVERLGPRAICLPTCKNSTGLEMYMTVELKHIIHFVAIYNLPGLIADFKRNASLIYIKF